MRYIQLLACAHPLRVHDGSETPSTITPKRASTIAEIRKLGVTEAVSRANQIKRPLHSEMQGPFEFVLPINWADFYCRNYCFGLAAGDVPPPTTEPVCAFLELRQPGVQKRLVVPLLLPI